MNTAPRTGALTGPTTGRTIVLIACTKQKKREAAPARELYSSTLFRKALAYAETLRLHPGQKLEDYTFVLSAKHGLLTLDQVVDPYEASLSEMTAEEREAWGQLVADQLGKRADLWSDHFVLLAGREYREPLLPYLRSFEAPMQGLGIGEQVAWLSRQIAERLHFSRT